MSSLQPNGRCHWNTIYTLGERRTKLSMPNAVSWAKGTFRLSSERTTCVRRLTDEHSYKDAGEALRRKQDKEREAAGLPPVQRLGARAAAPQRGQRGAAGGRGAQRGGPARAAAPVARGGSHRTFHQPDKNLYVHLLGHLRKKSLLPVVVFTLSKKRCEENASTLTNADLCSAVEKSEIHVALEKAFSRLKGIFIFRRSFSGLG